MSDSLFHSQADSIRGHLILIAALAIAIVLQSLAIYRSNSVTNEAPTESYRPVKVETTP